MTLGTFFTLFVVPTAYTLLARGKGGRHAAVVPTGSAPVATPAE
jgi:hypothetical protein